MDNNNQIALISDIPKTLRRVDKSIVSTNDDGKKQRYNYVVKYRYDQVSISDDDQKTKEAYHAFVVKECVNLEIAFPLPKHTAAEEQRASLFFSLLYTAIESKKMSIEQLRDAIKRLIMANKYKTYTIADIVDYDPHIILGTSMNALRKALNQSIINEQVYITYDIIDNKVVRLFGLRNDITSDPVYKDRILGEWDDQINGWTWTGHVDDPSMEERKDKFKKALCKLVYCSEKGCNGKYKPDIVEAFYERYSKTVPPGDKMFCETISGFNVENWLNHFSNKIEEKRKYGT